MRKFMVTKIKLREKNYDSCNWLIRFSNKNPTYNEGMRMKFKNNNNL